jgi:D-amino-acid dehydrogenase
MVEHARRMLPGLRVEDASYWMGFRPSMPDSLPVIGRAPGHANAYFAFGHGHVGLTLAAVTGRIVADQAAGRPPAFDLKPFRATRFS